MPSANDETKVLNLPFGFRFNPTDVELIEHYLIPKLQGLKLPSEYVMDLDDVYKYDPHQLPFMNQLKHARKNEIFVFTREDKRQIRATPNGYWKVDKENVAVDVGDDVIIGYKTKLFFHDLHGNLSDWKMTQFRCAIPINAVDMENYYIVCKIKLRMKEIVVEIISDDEQNASFYGPNSAPKRLKTKLRMKETVVEIISDDEHNAS